MSRLSSHRVSSLLAVSAGIAVASLLHYPGLGVLAAPVGSASAADSSQPVSNGKPNRPSRTIKHGVANSPMFDEDVNGWFDDLVDYLKPYHTGKNVTLPAFDLNLAASKQATARNFPNVIEAITDIIPTSSDVSSAPKVVALREKLVAQANKIAAKGYKAEFRLTYSRKVGDVSAAGEFCSMIRQACGIAASETLAEAKA